MQSEGKPLSDFFDSLKFLTTVLPYFGYYMNWKKLLTSLSRKTSKLWSDRLIVFDRLEDMVPKKRVISMISKKLDPDIALSCTSASTSNFKLDFAFEPERASAFLEALEHGSMPRVSKLTLCSINTIKRTHLDYLEKVSKD